MISASTIEKVQDAMRIEEVVHDAIPNLKRSGSNYKACCPFHSEKSPSFTVVPSRGIFKCFGCGAGGDAITFVMQNQGRTFPEAVEIIAKKYNIDVGYDFRDRDEHYDTRQQVRATMAAVQAHLVAAPEGEENEGYKYFLGRKLSPDTLNAYGIGYASGTTVPLVDPELLKQAGIANEKGNLSFYKRATIPLHNHTGAIVSMVGRSLDPNASGGDKYINGRTVPGVYEKGKFLFNLYRAHNHILKARELWIVEGYVDSMALTQMGKPNNIAICGTALTEAHIKDLKRYNGDKPLRIMLGIDAQTDKLTQNYRPEVDKAMWAAVNALLPLGEVRIVEWPKGCKDAGEMLERGIGFDAVKTEDAIELYIRRVCTKEWSNNASAVEKASVQETVSQMIALVQQDNVRDIYIKTLCDIIEIKPNKLDNLVKKHGKSQDAATKWDEFRHVKVLDEYLERQLKPDLMADSLTVVYVPRKCAELKFERGADYVRNIPKFHNWITEPDHIQYRRSIEIPLKVENTTYRYFNRYHPLPFVPKAFDAPAAFMANPDTFDLEKIPEIKNIAWFIKHIGGHAQHGNRWVNMLWDWITLCYINPKQRLPALALVSQEEGTGKSTFINLILKIFGQNATKIDANRIGANFNAMMSGKVFVGVEETKDEKGSIENKLKDLITGFEMVVERKHQDATVEDSFCKFCFASNHEDSFMKVGTATTRFFVLKVEPIPTSKYDPAFEEKMYREIPYLLHFMKVRGVLYNKGEKKNRLFFDPADLENEALLKLRQSSKDIVQQNIEELFMNIFIRTEVPFPIIRMSSEALKMIMIAWGGDLYKQKSPNYFNTVVTKDMRMVYREKPTTYETIQLSGLGNVHWSTDPRWEYELEKGKGRFVEFPIWHFVSPDDVADNYTPRQVQKLIEAFANIKSIEQYGETPRNWLATLQKIINILPEGEQQDLPF